MIFEKESGRKINRNVNPNILQTLHLKKYKPQIVVYVPVSRVILSLRGVQRVSLQSILKWFKSFVCYLCVG